MCPTRSPGDLVQWVEVGTAPATHGHGLGQQNGHGHHPVGHPPPDPRPQLEFLGRIDGQVKVNGVRMELAEIEAAVAAAPGVSAAAVRAFPDGRGGYRVAAFVEPAAADPRAVAEHCRGALLAAMARPRSLAAGPLLHSPSHHYASVSCVVRPCAISRTITLPCPAQVPSAVVALERFPRLPNGKTDTKALPEPAWGSGDTAAAAAAAGRGGGGGGAEPRTATEALLRGIWAEQLGLDPGSLSIEADFFEVRVRVSACSTCCGALVLCFYLLFLRGGAPPAGASQQASSSL